MVLLTGESDLAKGAGALLNLGPAAVLVPLGAKGAFCRTCKTQASVPAYDVNTIDTTGAGDAFLGALLWVLKVKNRDALAAFDDAKVRVDAAIGVPFGQTTIETKQFEIKDCQRRNKNAGKRRIKDVCKLKWIFLSCSIG